MSWKLVLCVMSFATVLSLFAADSVLLGDEKIAELAPENAALQTEYERTLPLRVDPASHLAQAAAVLNLFDGGILIDAQIGEDGLLLTWSAALMHVQATWNGEPLELALYYDAFGRPAFVFGKGSGWIDADEDYLYGELDLMGVGKQSYVGLVPSDGVAHVAYSAASLMSVAVAKKCVCKGTLGGGDLDRCYARLACETESTCRYKKPYGSQAWIASSCVWAWVPCLKQ